MNNRETYLYWLQANTQKNYLSEHKNLKEFNYNPQDEDEEPSFIDKAQNVADLVSAGVSFVPVVGQAVGAAIDVASAGVDLAQGQYGDSAMRGGMAAASAIPFAGGALKLGKAAKGVATAAKVGDAAAATRGLATATKAADTATSATQAARAGTQGAQAVAKAPVGGKIDFSSLDMRNKVKTNIMNSRNARMSSGYKDGAMQLPPKVTSATTQIARPQKSLLQKTAQRIRVTDKMAKTGRLGKLGKYGRLGLLAYGASKLMGGDEENDGSDRGRQRQASFLDPAEAEVRSNLVGQAANPTMSRRREDQRDPAFGYYGAQAMFRPIGYGTMEEGNLNKMVNGHVQKFLKSRHGKKLKTEVNSIVKKVD